MRINFVQNILDKINHKQKVIVKNLGKNNIINFPKLNTGTLKISVYGNNNQVSIGDIGYFRGEISVGSKDCPVENCKVSIGNKTTSNGVSIILLENNSYITIGEDCMFSSGIYIACSDTHTITDMDENLINLGHYVTIGNHVWVGMNSHIGKNVSISDNSIVGMSSVVTSKIPFPKNSIIAGNPAKVVKNNIKWNRLRPQQYIQQGK